MTTHVLPEFIVCDPVGLPAMPADAEPSALYWVRVAPIGQWSQPRTGAFVIDAKVVAQMAENFARSGVEVVVDYEHQTLSGVKAPAAGWIKAVEPREDGLWAQIGWTEEARRMIRAKEYQYYSPVLNFAGRDTHTGEPIGAALHSVALTNTPLLAGDILPLAAKLTGALALPNPEQESRIMDWKELAKLLGLAEDASEADIRAGLVALKNQPDELQTRIAELEAENEGLVAAKAAAAQEQPSVDDLQKQIAELSGAIALRDATDAVNAAVTACKIAPAQREWAIDYAQRDAEGFAKFVEAAPKLIAAKATAPPGADGAPALTEQQLAICKQLDIDPAKYAEQLKADTAA